MNVQFHCMIEKASVEEEKKRVFPIQASYDAVWVEYRKGTSSYSNTVLKYIFTCILYQSIFIVGKLLFWLHYRKKQAIISKQINI